MHTVCIQLHAYVNNHMQWHAFNCLHTVLKLYTYKRKEVEWSLKYIQKYGCDGILFAATNLVYSCMHMQTNHMQWHAFNCLHTVLKLYTYKRKEVKWSLKYIRKYGCDGILLILKHLYAC